MEYLIPIAIALIGAAATIAAARIAKGKAEPQIHSKPQMNTEAEKGLTSLTPELAKEAQHVPLTQASRITNPETAPDTSQVDLGEQGSLDHSRPTVLLVDDQPGDVTWLIDFLSDNGCDIHLATNEAAAKRALVGMAEGKYSYLFAIFDIMVTTVDLAELLDFNDLDEDFFQESHNAGLRLCRFARDTLYLSEEILPIACISIRNDDDLILSLREMNIPLYARISRNPSGSICDFITARLSALKEDSEEATGC